MKAFSILFICLFGSVQLSALEPVQLKSSNPSMTQVIAKCPCGCNKNSGHRR